MSPNNTFINQNLPATQKAGVLQNGTNSIDIADVPMPRLKSGQILVKLNWSGVCHSDISIAHNRLPGTPFREWVTNNARGVMGHEGVGRVVAMAEDVTAEASWKIGDRAAIKWVSGICGQCDMCATGKEENEVLCLAQQNPGFTEPGTYQQYTATDAKFATHVPDGVADEEAAPLLCAGLTAFGAVKRSQISQGEWLVILGAGGGVGHMALQYAKMRGIRVIAVDIGTEKGVLCQELGADHYVDAEGGLHDMEKTIQELTGSGAHGVIMATLSREAYDIGPNLLRPRGTMVVVAFVMSLEFKAGANPVLLANRMIAIVGSTTGSRRDMDEVLDLAARKNIVPRITKAPLKDINEYMHRVEEGKILGKVVLQIPE